MSERRTPWVVYAVIVANVAMFAVEIASGANPIKPDPPSIVALGGNLPSLTLHGEWWRLGSSMFLHFGIVHLAFNMLCLYQARVVEPVFGRAAFVVIYVLAGLGGGVAHLITGRDLVVAAGASGAVFGVYGALATKLAIHRARFDPEIWSTTIRRLGKFFVLNAAVGILTPGISLSAHVGGLVVGIAVSAVMLAGAGTAQPRIARTLGLAAVGIALTAGALTVIDAGGYVYPVLHRFDLDEHATASARRAAVARFKAGEIKEPEFIAIMERDVIEHHRRMRADMRATKDVPERLQARFARADDLFAARLAEWDAFKAFAAENDPEKRKQLLEVHQRAVAAVDDRLEQLNAEIKRENNP